MKTLHKYFQSGYSYKLDRGTPVLPEILPAPAADLLNDAGWALNVEWNLLTPEKLLQQFQQFFAVNKLNAGAYLVKLSNNKLIICSADPAGCFYGISSAIQQIKTSPDRGFVLADIPRGNSGLKLYLPSPSPEGIADFKRIIDFAAMCRCNFIMLELGGALEYKSHPEINSAWMDYCRIMNEYPGKTLDVQNAYPWKKNSIHSENGGGKIVQQSVFMELVNYCRERFMEIIPEMPSLSHSDYILAAHPGLAERPDDPFPDTCCPLNEKYHQLYNDLLDEVIDLIHPARINICHDELYTVNVCDRCRHQSPSLLYANNINRIAAYLRSKNVQTVIWGEKLLDSHWQNGTPIGGAAQAPENGKAAVPALWQSREYITGDLEIMHWYWTVDRRLDNIYAQKNFRYYFANLSPAMFKDWSKRIAAPLATGTCVSNWGETSWRTLQRNGVLYDLLYTSFLMWNDDLTEDDFKELDDTVFRTLFHWTNSSRPAAGWLEITHTTASDIKFQYFFDGFLLDEKSFYLGDHIFTDEAGRQYRFPVIFGSNISNDNVLPQRTDDPEGLRDAWVYDLQHTEVAGECIKEYDDDSTVWYTCRYRFPQEARELKYITFESAPGKDIQVRIRNWSFI